MGTGAACVEAGNLANPAQGGKREERQASGRRRSFASSATMKEQASPSIPLKGEEVPVQGLGASQPALLVSVLVAVASVAVYLGLGRLRNSGKTGGASQGNSSDPFMDKTRKKFKLVDKLALSPNTHKYRFCLDRPEQILGLPVGKHLKLFAPAPAARVQGQWNNAPDPEAEQAEIERKYTPVTGDRVQGYVDLIIKVYRRGEVEQFPDGGKMSQYLDSLRVGDYVDVMGPFGLIEYLGNGEFRVNRRMIKKKKIGMVAGGTGITPMYQLASEILGTGSDPTCLSLLFANRTKEDILLRDELEEMQEAYPDQFRVAFTVDEPGPSWRFFSGFVDEAMLRATMPPPSPDTLILLCGAPPMVRSCMEKLLALGYAKEDILEF